MHARQSAISSIPVRGALSAVRIRKERAVQQFLGVCLCSLCFCSRADDNHQLSTAGKSTADLKCVNDYAECLAMTSILHVSDYNGRHIFSQRFFKGLLLLIQAGSGKSLGSAAPAFWPWGSSGG